jgi:hypothetical protein
MSRGAADTSVRATLQPTFCYPVVLDTRKLRKHVGELISLFACQWLL